MTPVTVTLTFPTYEDTIIALSKLRAGPQPEVKPETVKPDPKAEAKAEAKAETKPKAEATKPKAEAKKAEAEAEAETKTTEPESAGLVYETDVAPKIAAAVKTNRADVIAVLGRFEAKTGKDLKPEQYADFLEQLTTRLEAAGSDLS